MSFIPVAMYLGGIGVFGFSYYLLNSVFDEIVALGLHETGTIWSFLDYIWVGILLIYLIFGGWWVVRKYNEAQYQQGGGLI